MLDLELEGGRAKRGSAHADETAKRLTDRDDLEARACRELWAPILRRAALGLVRELAAPRGLDDWRSVLRQPVDDPAREIRAPGNVFTVQRVTDAEGDARVAHHLVLGRPTDAR